MIQAKRPFCRVEIYFNEVADLSQVAVVEDETQDFQSLVKTLNSVSVKSLRYLSCGGRVFISGLYDAVDKKHKPRYRQACGGDHSPSQHCFQHITVRAPSLRNSDWQSFEAVSPGNLNQLQQIRYHIPFPDSTGNNGTSNVSNIVMELEFQSLVAAESWSGNREGLIHNWAATHGVWLNDKYGAIVGKQYLFKSAVTIRLDALLRTKKGDNLFTVRYRMVDSKQARTDMRLGEVLLATSKAKTLQFKIPQQFSTRQLHEILKKKQFEYEYEAGAGRTPSGDFPIWLFQHQYTIRPSNPKCQVMLKFIKMDVGSGYLAGKSSLYNNVQHRLLVVLNSNVTRRIPLTCASLADETGSERLFMSNETLCARMDRTYASAPGATMAVLFQSTNHGEYEYDFVTHPISGFRTGPEMTFGDGWTARYQQICDSAKAEVIAKIPLTAVTAKLMRHDHNWQQNLPGQFKSDKYRLFRDKRWIITPQQTGYEVQYSVQTKMKLKEPIPLLFQVGNHAQIPRANKTYIDWNVTIVQLGTSQANPITINYRQICPTAAPTTPSPAVTAQSKVDGETCTYDGECSSGICSKMLQRCTAKTCAAQCATKASSQAICQAFVVVGCSCQWSSQSGSCILIS